MFDPPQPSSEILDWLTSLRLPLYAPSFLQGGYGTLEDCKGLTDDSLLGLHVYPTGHRRRILRSLEALGVSRGDGPEEERRAGKGWPRERHILLVDKKRAASCNQRGQQDERSRCDVAGCQTLPPGAGLRAEAEVAPYCSGAPTTPLPDPCHVATRSHPSSSASSGSSDSLAGVSSGSEVPSDWEVSSEDPSLPGGESAPCPPADESPPTAGEEAGDFLGSMVENDIYERGTSVRAPGGLRPTRSYRLRHRPVPELPNLSTLPAAHNWSAAAAVAVQTSSPEHTKGGSEGPEAPEKAKLQRTLTPIVPYGETFLYNNPSADVPEHGSEEQLKKKEVKKKQKKVGQQSYKRQTVMGDQAVGEGPPLVPASADPCGDDYATLEECSASAETRTRDPRSNAADPPEGPVKNASPPSPDISPYACFYGAPKDQVVKAGWLDKLSPQGNYVFQRRWVRFDGKSLAYYHNDKEMYSKGMISASVIRQVRGLGDNKFEVVTSLRTFIFRTEREGERQEWMETLQMASRPPPCNSQKPSHHFPLPSLSSCSSSPSSSSSSSSSNSAIKSGLLELRGYRGRVLVSLWGNRVRLCKTEQWTNWRSQEATAHIGEDYKAGLAITEVDLTAATIKEVDRRSFDINTPFKIFCFTAESEQQREEWIEAVQESITETLSDYEVAEKIWFNEANRTCADCCAPRPEWASVNLGVVICKKCAGQQRSLGPSISKVRSLKLDSSIWSNELVELFLEVGNMNANRFWAASLPLEEEIHAGASTEQRTTFLRRKYRERRYCKIVEGLLDQEQLNQALCLAVVSSDVLRTMELVFSGADVMCSTGDPDASTPYLLAQRAGQRLQMELLHHNKLSDFPKLEQGSDSGAQSDVRPFMDGFLYVSLCPSKVAGERRGREDMSRRWCTLESGFLSYYDNERSLTPIGRVDITQVVSMAVSDTETMTGAGAVFTAGLYLQTERVLLLGAKTLETRHDWLQALTKCFAPSKVEGMLQRDCELIGRLHYKEGHDLYHWRIGWFALEGSSLKYSSGEGEGMGGALQLKQLQELTVSTHTEGEDKIKVLLMVGGGRTVYIHGFNNVDFTLWHAAITLAAGTDGRALGDQQLSKNGVPIVVDSCIAFVTQYGLAHRGVYEQKGEPSRVALLLEDFARDARNVKLREQEHKLGDVTDTLKSFLSQAEDALLAKELYPYWVSALDEEEEGRRVMKYSTFIESLPKVNRSTLEALLQHLYRIQQCSHLNQMPSQRLASAFSACLFQTQGQTAQEVTVVRELIDNYVTLFKVSDDQVQQMERENSFIARWNEKKDSIFSPAGDLIFEVYLEKKKPETCCLIKLSPSMQSTELAEKALSMRKISLHPEDLWLTFEVIENSELERPLHHKDNILEQVLEWSALDDPSSAFLVVKKHVGSKMAGDVKDPKQCMKKDHLKVKAGSSKLLSGHKFQDKYVELREMRLLLYKDNKSAKAEREVLLKAAKCYLGLRRKLKAPTGWGFTVYTGEQQWYFCCAEKESQISWVNALIRMKHGGDFWPKAVSSRGAAVPKAHGGPPVTKGRAEDSRHGQQSVGNQSKGTKSSPGHADPMPAKDAGLHHKTAAPSGCRRLNDGLGVPVTPNRRAPNNRRAPVGVWPPRSADESPGGRKASLGGASQMPPMVLSELNSVLKSLKGSTAVAGRATEEEGGDGGTEGRR